MAPCNLAGPSLAPWFRRPDSTAKRLFRACSAPVPDLLTRLFRARPDPQPTGWVVRKPLIYQQCVEQGADRGEKNRLLAGAPTPPAGGARGFERRNLSVRDRRSVIGCDDVRS